MPPNDTSFQISVLSAQVRTLTEQLKAVQLTADATFAAANAMAKHIFTLDTKIADLEAKAAASVITGEQQHLLIPDDFPWRITGFGCRAVNIEGNSFVKVMKGVIHYHGKDDYEIAKTNIQIDSGTVDEPMWVYVRGTGIVGFSLSTSMTRPKSDNIEYKFPLCAAYRSGAGTEASPYHAVIVYYAQIGDINILVPLR